ncbi:MAG: hypothetical protein FWH55_08610, partial [Oscillospiraceae bacterium]|nr:hypothetical protein [Oscillospiraceae bacterium]
MKGLKKFKKCFAVLLVLSIILSLTPTMAFAEIGDYAQIQDVDLGFHHGTSPNGGQNVTKNIGYTKKAYEWFVQIGENQWLLVTKIGETADGVPIFGENTDYVCPICGSTNWISYSNNSDILGGHFNGKNMQVAHVHTGAANLSGDVAFSKMKFVDADFEFATSADGFLFDLYSSDANGNISPGDGPINSEPLSIDAADDYGTISFHFSQEGGYLPGWYIFIERENPEWQIDSAYANGILFYLDIVGSTLVPNWPNGEPFSGVIINNYPILGDLTISATDSTVQDEVQYRDVEQRDVWDIVQRNVWDITQRDVWDITRRDVWDITQRDVWDITQRDVWDIVQRNVWDITQRDVWDITQRNVWDITQRDVWDITQRDVWDITQRDIWDITQRDVWQTFQGQVWDIMQREIQPYIRPVFEKDVSSESGTLVTWLENGSVPGGKFGNYMTWMEVDVAEASKPGGIDYTISDSSPSNNPIEYSYNIRIEGDKLFLSLDDRLISASVTAKLYDSIPSTHDPSGHTNLKNGQVLVVPLPAVKSDPNPAAPTAVAVKNGNDINVSVTYNGSVVKTFTGAYVKNGQETFEDDGYKVTVTYNGNGVNKVTLVSYPDLAAPGGEPSALETIYMFVHFDGAKWFTTGDYEFIKWESAGKDEGEYMVVGHGSNDQVLDGSSDYYKVGDGAGESKKVGDGAGEYKKVGDGAGEYKKVGDGAGEYKKVGDGAG